MFGLSRSRPPLRAVGHELADGVYFATESTVWTGGRAFYNPTFHGTAVARAHLITYEQFANIAAQEVYRAPTTIWVRCCYRPPGTWSGRYETLLHCT
ncbi:MAG: hypothetical protein M3186_08500 [Actinomycetota bacterium]|nr:hypothetical protein [Actinomycetota bacterium]